MRTEEILELLQQVADEIITPRFHALGTDQIFEKQPGDYVTVADREAEVRITERLLQAYPDALIVGEENTFERPDLPDGLATASHAFTVDPIDGTGNFVKGSPDHAVMVAELRDGALSRSWIWQPQHKRAYIAEAGKGVTVNGEALHGRPMRDLPTGGTSRKLWQGFDADGELDPVSAANNCAGMDYPDLLHGERDYYVYFMPKPWDHLPGQLMLKEAGGDVLNLDGQPYQPGRDPQPIFASADGERLGDVVTLWRERWAEIDAQ